LKESAQVTLRSFKINGTLTAQSLLINQCRTGFSSILTTVSYAAYRDLKDGAFEYEGRCGSPNLVGGTPAAFPRAGT
jgi:hypothetical protein